MRQDRMLDPHNQPNTAAERRLGVTPQREQNRAQERAQRYQENKGLAVVDDEGRLIGELIRELAVIGSGATVTVQGNRVTIDVSGGGGGTTIAVQEGDITESLTVSVLDFLDADFDVTISPAGEANVALATGIDAAKIGGGAVSTTEFDYLNGVTSNIQTQIDARMTHPQVISRLWLVG